MRTEQSRGNPTLLCLVSGLPGKREPVSYSPGKLAYEAGIRKGCDVTAVDRGGRSRSAAGVCVESDSQDSARSAWTGRVPDRNGTYCLFLGDRKRFRVPVSARYRTNSVADAGLSAAGRGNLQTVWHLYPPCIFRRHFSEHWFLRSDMRADFLCGETGGGARRCEWRRVAVGFVHQCDH